MTAGTEGGVARAGGRWSPRSAGAIIVPLIEFFFFAGLVLLLFKNAVIATLLNFVTLNRGDAVTLALQATDFVCFFLAAALAALISKVRVFGRVGFFPLVLSVTAAGLTAYFVYGALAAGASGALAYLRSYLVPFMALFIGATLRERIVSAPRRMPYLLIGAATLLYLLLELIAPQSLYSVVRIGEFSVIKWGEYFDPADFLNMLGLPIGGYVINRLIGPQLHPVSLGYFLLFVLTLILSSERRTFSLGRAVSVIVLLVVIAFCSKGAFAVAIVLAGTRVLGLKLTRLQVTVFALAYLVPLLLLGALPFTTAHIHMEGLRAGLSAMTAHPLGVGLGVGGNLSSVHDLNLGYESFIGVMLSQLGLFGIVFLAMVVHEIYGAMRAPKARFFGLACTLILLNSLLQEEAFSLTGIFLPLVYLVAIGVRHPAAERGRAGRDVRALSGLSSRAVA